ncbi:MAG TPA: DUF4232 domain-containing protein [Streptosporangiaceae bacterium]|jgi:hypothetical protein|nr:DUF4232 domain-containing protein [Streptosporangiaceae bacterium]
MKASSASAGKATVLAAVYVAAGLLAGCGSSPSPPAQPTATVTVTVTAPATPATPATSPAPPAGSAGCPTSALTMSLGPGNGAAGSSYYPIEFTNASSTTCSLYGYPGVSFLAASGAQIGAAATEDPTYPRMLVTLTPGSTVHAELRITDAQNYPPSTCDPVAAYQLRIFPPGQTSALNIRMTAMACSNTSVQILSVQTVQPGSGSE